MQNAILKKKRCATCAHIYRRVRLEHTTQAIISYIGVVVLLSGAASGIYLFSPVKHIKQLHTPTRYFMGYYTCTALAFVIFSAAFPNPNLLSIIITNSFFALSFYFLKYGFASRKNPDYKPLFKDPIVYTNLFVLAIIMAGPLYAIHDSVLLRTALITFNCAIISLTTLKHIARVDGQRDSSENLAYFSICVGIALSAVMFLTLVIYSDAFTYLSVLVVAQSVLNILLLGSTLSLFLSDLSAMYYQESITDELTGLYNRRFFLRRASQETNASFRYKFPVSIILCDIDNFKKVNDNYGHLVGDHVLQAFSKLLKKCTRESDVLARFGGEEFIIMLPQTDKNGAYVLAERMRQETEALSVDESKKAQDVKFTASFGVTTCTSNNSIEQNIHLVDEALYSAKESGKNRVIITEAQETNLDDSL